MVSVGSGKAKNCRIMVAEKLAEGSFQRGHIGGGMTIHFVGNDPKTPTLHPSYFLYLATSFLWPISQRWLLS